VASWVLIKFEINKPTHMKRIIILTLTILISTPIWSQTKNFIDQPYIETKAKVDTLVTPDLIYLSIFISEQDTKGKISVEEQENKMASKLKSLGIDLDKQLMLSDLGSNFKKYFLKSQDIQKNKSYSLLVYDAKVAGDVIQGLEKIGVSNVDLERTEYSKMEELRLGLKSKAISKAKLQAEYLVNPLGQKVGAAIYISDKFNQVYRTNQLDEVVVMGYAGKKKEYISIDIEFKKIEASSEVNVKFKLLP
jgi:uncharacterized protein YggE